MANLQSESSNHGLRYMLSQYWQDNGNPRTAGLPLIREGPWFTFCVIGVYLLFVTKVGPAMMRKRAAYQLRLPMLVYNSSMVVINFYFLFKSLVCQWWILSHFYPSFLSFSISDDLNIFSFFPLLPTLVVAKLRPWAGQLQVARVGNQRQVQHWRRPRAGVVLLPVLADQVCRPPRHHLLCAAEEGPPDHSPAPVPPLHCTDPRLVLHLVRFWRACHQPLRLSQLLLSHYNVLLLRPLGAGTANSAVPVVEEVHHPDSAAAVSPAWPVRRRRLHLGHQLSAFCLLARH